MSNPKPKVIRAPSPYILFCNEKRQSVKDNNPNITFGQQGVELGRIWAYLSDEEKMKYSDQHEEIKKKINNITPLLM
jgi:hypothetical protein